MKLASSLGDSLQFFLEFSLIYEQLLLLIIQKQLIPAITMPNSIPIQSQIVLTKFADFSIVSFPVLTYNESRSRLILEY